MHQHTPDTMLYSRVLYFKSSINVTAFINETQVFIHDKSNFINNPLYTSMYIQAESREDLPQ